MDEIFEIPLTAAIFIVDGSFFAYNLELYVCFRLFHFVGRALEEIWTPWQIGLKHI